MRFKNGLTLSIALGCNAIFSRAYGQAIPIFPSTATETQGQTTQIAKNASCLDKTDGVNDIASYVSASDLGGTSQTIEQTIYEHSACLNANSNNRWQVIASAAHVAGGGYRAEAGSLGGGIVYYPFAKDAGFSLNPVAIIEYDHIPLGNDRIAFGGVLTAAQYFTLKRRKSATREAAAAPADNTLAPPVNQMMVAANVAYRGDHVLGTAPIWVPKSQQQWTGYGTIGWDGYFGHGGTRWQANMSYQTIDEPYLKGFAGVAFSLRWLDSEHRDYKKMVQIFGNFGNHYRAVILGVDFRWGLKRKVSDKGHTKV